MLGAAGAEPAGGAVQGPAAGGGQRQGLPRAQGEDQEGEQRIVSRDQRYNVHLTKGENGGRPGGHEDKQLPASTCQEVKETKTIKRLSRSEAP